MSSDNLKVYLKSFDRVSFLSDVKYNPAIPQGDVIYAGTPNMLGFGGNTFISIDYYDLILPGLKMKFAELTGKRAVHVDANFVHPNGRRIVQYCHKGLHLIYSLLGEQDVGEIPAKEGDKMLMDHPELSRGLKKYNVLFTRSFVPLLRLSVDVVVTVSSRRRVAPTEI